MQLTSWNAFKLSVGIYLMGYWISAISFQKSLFVYFNQASDYTVNWWLWLDNQHLLNPYLYFMAFSAIGIAIPKLTRIISILNIVNLLLLYRFTNGVLISPSTPFFGWALLWMSFFPKELSKSDKKIWWIVVTIGYFCSGMGKLLSPLWASGEALSVLSLSNVSVLNSSLEDFALIKKILTIFTLLVEMGGIFIIWWDWGRKILWYSLIAFLCGIIFFMNVPEIGLGMLIINLALWEDSPFFSKLYSRLLIGYNTFIKKKKSNS